MALFVSYHSEISEFTFNVFYSFCQISWNVFSIKKLIQVFFSSILINPVLHLQICTIRLQLMRRIDFSNNQPIATEQTKFLLNKTYIKLMFIELKLFIPQIFHKVDFSSIQKSGVFLTQRAKNCSWQVLHNAHSAHPSLPFCPYWSNVSVERLSFSSPPRFTSIFFSRGVNDLV